MAKKKNKRPKEGKKKRVVPQSANKKKGQSSQLNNPHKKWWTNQQLLLSVAGILLLTCLAFSPMLNNEFTNWDDKLYVTENNLITDLSTKGISEIFSSNVVSNYHPITILSLAINYQFAELSPFAYLSTNLLLHVLNTFLVFLFVYKLSGAKTSIALIVSLFFGIHPMHVESVAWISERKDVLFTFFFLLGLLVYLDYLKKPDVKKYLGLLILLLLSLLSKPAAVVFPVILLLIDYYKERKFTTKVLLEKIPFFVLALAIGILTLQIQSERAMEVMSRFDVLERLLLSSYGFVIYISKLFFPWPLSTLHPFPQPGNLPMIYMITPLITLAILGAVYYFRKNRTLIFGLLFYLVGIAPVMQFITIGNAVVAERYTYVPYIGLFYILGHFYYQIANNKIMVPGGKNMGQVILGLMAIAFMVLTFQRTKVWQNSETLWTDVIKTYPDNERAFLSRAIYYMEKKQHDPAIADFTRAISLSANYPEPLEYRGRTYLELNQPELAFSDFDRWVKIRPQNPLAYALRGTTLSNLNRPEEALSDFNKVLELEPNNTSALNNRGTLYFNKKQEYQKALADFNVAIALDPNYGTAYLNRSRCYYMLNDRVKALQDANHAQQLGVPVPAAYLETLK